VALAGRRDAASIVSKVDVAHATRDGTVAARERGLDRLATDRSLDRLAADRVDLYLLQSRGEHPLEDTVAAFESCAKAG
jgi:diketogulonate reductase-like aldo/keto reductase